LGPQSVNSWNYARRNGATLLAVVREHLRTSLAQLGAILLKAGQNGEITLIHQLPAVPRHIARASFLLGIGSAVRLFGHRSSRADHQQSEY
jgi:hypothetical protein